ncbi:MAG TPA: hypothetical protein VLI39_08275 [Sedimentisphaerales bacterium]|nr:hypothetical protein [Sedimentisphaerales bacterium]
MKELDFLPDWYKDRKRRHSQVRKQYIALAAVFLMMMTFNVTALHRATTVAAEVSRQEEQRAQAEATVHEFNLVTRELNQIKAKADLVRRIDTRIDIAPILAEISHIVDESVVLSKVELVGEPVSSPNDVRQAQGPSVRAFAADDWRRAAPLGESTLRVVLAGVAAQPKDVADLVFRLDQSGYFRQVRPSFYGRSQVQIDPAPAVSTTGTAPRTDGSRTMDVTAFEITCALANYEEGDGR